MPPPRYPLHNRVISYACGPEFAPTADTGLGRYTVGRGVPTLRCRRYRSDSISSATPAASLLDVWRRAAALISGRALATATPSPALRIIDRSLTSSPTATVAAGSMP